MSEPKTEVTKISDLEMQQMIAANAASLAGFPHIAAAMVQIILRNRK